MWLGSVLRIYNSLKVSIIGAAARTEPAAIRTGIPNMVRVVIWRESHGVMWACGGI